MASSAGTAREVRRVINPCVRRTIAGLGLNDLGLGLDGLSLNFIHGLNFIAN